jgi:hypothetical protein
MNYFGDSSVQQLEYEKPKVNYSEQWDKLFNCEDINEGMIIPFMKRLSCAGCNVKRMQLANQYFFTVDKSVVKRFIVLQKNHSFKFMKSLKKDTQDDKFDFLIEAVCKYYGWSRREYEIHKEFINLLDADLHQLLHRRYGFDKKECKILGLQTEKIKVKFEKVVKQVGYF